MRVESYAPHLKAQWDQFVQRSKNGTFLLERDYVEYHADRFSDSSLLIFKDSALVALIPAHTAGTAFHSHAGLTYGGFVTSEEMKLPVMLEVFEVVADHLRQAGITDFFYKTVPYIYHAAPADEDRYALFVCNATVIRRSILSVAGCASPFALQDRRRRGARKAQRNGVTVTNSAAWEEYWNLLSERLHETYKTSPVHTIEEITRLHARFPENIKLFAAHRERRIIAGVVIFETPRVARTQYIAADATGREFGALDLIMIELLTDVYRSKAYLDFGSSEGNDGQLLNSGLIDQKEGYGARSIAHDHYRISIAEWTPGTFVRTLK